MSDVNQTKRYILREPIEAKEGWSSTLGEVMVLKPEADGVSQVDINLFNELFVELPSEETLRQQIREKVEQDDDLRYFAMTYCEHNSHVPVSMGMALDDLTDAIVELLALFPIQKDPEGE